MKEAPGQYTPLTPMQIIGYFQEVKSKIELIEQKMADIIRLNGLATEEPPSKPAKSRTKMAKVHDDAAEDESMVKSKVNKAVAKHVASAHPGKKPTKVKCGGRVAAKTGMKKGGRCK